MKVILVSTGVPGMFKHETNWFSIDELAALRPKQYSYTTEKGKGGLRAKGINKEATKMYLTHQAMVDQVLNDENATQAYKNSFKSRNSSISTDLIVKQALVNYENKRYVLDPIYSIPW